MTNKRDTRGRSKERKENSLALLVFFLVHAANSNKQKLPHGVECSWNEGKISAVLSWESLFTFITNHAGYELELFQNRQKLQEKYGAPRTVTRDWPNFILEDLTEAHLIEMSTEEEEIMQKGGLEPRSFRLLNLPSENPEECVQFVQDRLKKSPAGKKPNPDKSGNTRLRAPVNLLSTIETVREKVRADIENRCGTTRVLLMPAPIPIEKLYTSITIPQEISERDLVPLYKELSKVLLDEEEYIEQYSKVMILGNPGSGKTTFLKRLAILCNRGTYKKNCIPVFVDIKQWAKNTDPLDLLEYIRKQWEAFGILNPNVTVDILKQGNALVLLDGLDEASSDNRKFICRAIEEFTNNFLNCQVVVSCRTAASEYVFERFTKLEIPAFNNEQINIFAKKWFSANTDPSGANEFIQRLEQEPKIQELANNPLLLTLLCCVFKRGHDFPFRRSDLYRQAFDVLFSKWDASRYIERDKAYKSLSSPRRQKLLSYIAYQTFTNSENSYKENSYNKRTITNLIEKYILNLPTTGSNSPESSDLDKEAVLRSIESQHGLLTESFGRVSFSHLTFQEFLVADYIVDSGTELENNLQELVSKIGQKQWREIFLLTAEMLEPADVLVKLMKARIDSIVLGDEKIKDFLTWLYETSLSIETSYNIGAIRAFYFALSCPLGNLLYRNFELLKSLDSRLYSKLNHARDLERNYYLSRDTACSLMVTRKLEPDTDHTLDLLLQFDLIRTLDRADNIDSDPTRIDRLNRNINQLIQDSGLELEKSLQILKNQLADPSGSQAPTELWKMIGRNWEDSFRSLVEESQGIGRNWELSEAQKKKLWQYYDATRTLVDCLKSDSYISQTLRDEIESSILLPV